MAGRAALTIPALPALLAACTPNEGPAPSPSRSPYAIAKPRHPVTLPVRTGLQPIAAGLPPESNATLELYTWTLYVAEFVVARFAAQFDAEFRIDTFHDIATEAIPKLASGVVTPDVFWTTFDYLSRLVAADLLQPLNHTYVPNLRTNVWPALRDPFYDEGSRYSIPYAVFTTGIGYRRDRVSDDAVSEKGWAIFWDPEHAGTIGIYDDYREAIALALLRRGITDLNTSDRDALAGARRDLLALRENGVRVSANGVLTDLPSGQVSIHQARSGDVVAAQSYLTEGESADVLGFWWPPDGRGPVANDAMVIPAAADHPVLAHLLLDFLLDVPWALRNFAWTGYQPPLVQIDADRLIGGGYVAESLSGAVVTGEAFARGLLQTELEPADDRRWQEVWAAFRGAD